MRAVSRPCFLQTGGQNLVYKALTPGGNILSAGRESFKVKFRTDKSPEAWVVPPGTNPSEIVTSKGLTGSSVFSIVPRASVVQAPLSAVGPGESATVAASADVCRGLSGTASSGSAAVGVPSEVHMTGTSRGSLAGEPASADCSTINARGEGLSYLRRWKSRKQNAVAASSCEAEYIVLFESSKDTVWLRSLLCKFGYCPGSQPSLIHHDKPGSIDWAKNDTVRRDKHISLRNLYTHDLIESVIIPLQYIESCANRADCLTKPITGAQFMENKQSLKVRN
jgi:hypothetical protein